MRTRHLAKRKLLCGVAVCAMAINALAPIANAAGESNTNDNNTTTPFEPPEYRRCSSKKRCNVCLFRRSVQRLPRQSVRLQPAGFVLQHLQLLPVLDLDHDKPGSAADGGAGHDQPLCRPD